MPKSKPTSKPKQKLKQDDRTAQLEQQLLAVVKQKDEKIAQLKIEFAEMEQLKDDRIAQLEQQIAEVKLKQQEEQETKSRRCKEQMEKVRIKQECQLLTLQNQLQEKESNLKFDLLRMFFVVNVDRQHCRAPEKEYMDLPLKKPHESFEHSKRNLTPPAEIPLPGGEDQTQPGGEDQTQPGGEDQTQPGGEDQTQPGGEDQTQPGGEDQTQPVGSLGEKTEIPSWFNQSEATNFEIVVDLSERTNSGISEHEKEILDNLLGDPLDPIALHQTNPIAKIPCATPVFESNVKLDRFLLRELSNASKDALTPIDETIVSKLRTRFKDVDFKDHNRKCKQKHAIHKHPVHKTVRTICFLKLAKPSQSDFDSMKYRNEHPFPYFVNGSYEHDFYNRIRGGDGDLWLKVVEETAKKLGELEWQYFKSCELIAQVNHEVHPVIAPEKLISYCKQRGFNCRGVDYRIIVEHMANSLIDGKEVI